MNAQDLPVSRYYDSQSLRMHYLDWGNHGAPLLILQHGGLDHAHSMDWIAREMAQDWHVVAPDLRGHGDSDWSPDCAYTMDERLLDFANLIEALGAREVTICAHSLGAIVTTLYAGLYPDRVARFINIEGLTLPKFPRPDDFADRLRHWVDMQQQATARALRRYADEPAAFVRMRESNPRLSDEQVRHLTHHALRANADGTLSWKFDPRLNIWPALAFPQHEVEALWEAITCPMLFFHGLESFVANPARDGRLGHFRDARMIEYDNATHWLHHDRFDSFIADLRAFLAEGA